MNISLNERFVAYFALISALAISSVAVFYSVSGLVAIYPMAVIPIVIMGVSIEVGKLAITLWLKQNWNAPALYKWTMIPAVLILMIITSGGVFGFLSKAHSDQSMISGDAISKVELIDDKIQTVKENINTQKENINAARSALAQLNNQVNARLDRGTDENSAERAVQIRRNQKGERNALTREISEAQEEIQKLNAQLTLLNEERAPLTRELRKVEAEVGPVRYIAALIYGDNPDANLLERAVRYVTLMIVIVLDPVAILLLLASQYSFQLIRNKKLGITEPTNSEPELETITTATVVEEVTTSTELTSDSTLPINLTTSTDLSFEKSTIDVVVYNEEAVIEPVATRPLLTALPIVEESAEANTVEDRGWYAATVELTTATDNVETLPVEEEPNIIESVVLEDKLNVAVVDTVQSSSTDKPEEEEEIQKKTLQELEPLEDPQTGSTTVEDSALYVQNEEQNRSNLWSLTSAHTSISQDEYIEKVMKLKGNNNG